MPAIAESLASVKHSLTAVALCVHASNHWKHKQNNDTSSVKLGQREDYISYHCTYDVNLMGWVEMQFANCNGQVCRHLLSCVV